MDLLVLSRAESLREAAHIKEPHIWISIRDPKDPWIEFPKNDARKLVLYLAFHDIQRACPGYVLMNEKHAQAIVSMVSDMKDRIKLIVVNCEAGISRSAGIAAALDIWLNGVDSFTGSSRYWPNVHVKSVILREIRNQDGQTD